MIYIMGFLLSGALGYYLWLFLNDVKVIEMKKYVKWLALVTMWLLSGATCCLCVAKFSGGTMAYIYYTVTVLIIVFGIIDVVTMSVPMNLVVVALLLGFASLWFNPNVIWYENMVYGGGVLLIMYGIHRVGRGALGLGDVWLVSLIALVLGWEQALIVFVLALAISGFLGAVLLISGKVTKKTVLPFVPFIALVQTGLLLI